MKIETTELLVITPEEHELLMEAQKFVQWIYQNARAGGDLENITFQLDAALDDLLGYENLNVE